MLSPIKTFALFCAFVVSLPLGFAEDGKTPDPGLQVPLVVGAGVPLRVYITKRLHMREGEAVEAKLIDPIYSFDRIVIPAGAQVQGHVTALDPVSKMKRTQAILNGDFTPLRFARVQFTNIIMPDGRNLAIQTQDSEGLPTLYRAPLPVKKPKNQNAGVLGTAKQQVQQQIETKKQTVIDVVRGPNKKEMAEDYLIRKLPYHPQWYRRNTRFDAVLTAPMNFGAAPIPRDALAKVGIPAAESFAQVRMLDTVSSADADTNTKISAVLSQPIFTPDHKLILPEGTMLEGRVRKAQRAKWFHRGGQLRFTFDRVEPPSFTAVQPVSVERTPVLLSRAEADPNAHVKIDSEGDAKATEPKSRFVAPVIAFLVATRSSDMDRDKTPTGLTRANGNYGGRGLGGFSGFGVFGTIAAQGSKVAGAVLGYYGFAWTVFETVVSRGSEVTFEKNAAIDVRFNGNPEPNDNKMKSHFASD